MSLQMNLITSKFSGGGERVGALEGRVEGSGKG